MCCTIRGVSNILLTFINSNKRLNGSTLNFRLANREQDLRSVWTPGSIGTSWSKEPGRSSP